MRRWPVCQLLTRKWGNGPHQADLVTVPSFEYGQKRVNFFRHVLTPFSFWFWKRDRTFVFCSREHTPSWGERQFCHNVWFYHKAGVKMMFVQWARLATAFVIE